MTRTAVRILCDNGGGGNRTPTARELRTGSERNTSRGPRRGYFTRRCRSTAGSRTSSSTCGVPASPSGPLYRRTGFATPAHAAWCKRRTRRTGRAHPEWFAMCEIVPCTSVTRLLWRRRPRANSSRLSARTKQGAGSLTGVWRFRACRRAGRAAAGEPGDCETGSGRCGATDMCVMAARHARSDLRDR